MEEKKICGLTIYFMPGDMRIMDSYKIRRGVKMKYILNKALSATTIYKTNRNIECLINEWIVHNLAYSLHIMRDRTKDCDLDSEMNKIMEIIYAILSFLSPIKIRYILDKRKIKKQEKKYKLSIKKHQNYILKAYNEMANCTFLYQLDSNNNILQELYMRTLIHDQSKFSKEEFEPYRKNFYPINQEEKDNNIKDFEKAFEHHWKNNPHHWQYRQNNISFDKNNPVQLLNVLENVMDWLARGYEFGNRPYQYYEKNKDKIILCQEEKDFIEKIIYEIDAEYIQKEINNETRERK